MAAARRTPEDPLLERGPALSAVRAALDAAAGGTGAVLLLSGTAGVGKTSLLDAARAESAARGTAVLSAACSPLEQSYSFGAVRQLLRPGDDVAAGGLLAAVPSGGADAFAVLEALHASLVRRAACGPLAVLVDDVHWCDEPSLRWLAFVVRRLGDLPVALMLTTRPVDADSQALAALLASPAVRRVDLAPLSGPASARLLRRRAGVEVDDALAVQCHAATGGNPFYLGVLAQAVRELGREGLSRVLVEHRGVLPAGVRRGILDRLTASGSDSVAVARAACVLGPDADPSTVAAVTGLSPPRVSDGVRAAGRAP